MCVRDTHGRIKKLRLSWQFGNWMEVKWKSIVHPPKKNVWQIQNSTTCIRDTAAGSGLESVIAEKKPLRFR